MIFGRRRLLLPPRRPPRLRSSSPSPSSSSLASGGEGGGGGGGGGAASRRRRRGGSGGAGTGVADEADVDATTGPAAAVDCFVRAVRSSLDDGTFSSFVLRGPPSPTKKKKNRKKMDKSGASSSGADDGGGGDGDDDDGSELLRGRYKSVTGRLILMKDKKEGANAKKRGGGGRRHPAKSEDADGDGDGDGDDGAPANGGGGSTTFVQATIKYHLATDVAKNWRVAAPRGGPDDEVAAGLRRLFSAAMGEDDDDDDASSTSSLLSEWGSGPRRASDDGDTGIRSGELVTTAGAYELRLRSRTDAVFRRLPDAPSAGAKKSRRRDDARSARGGPPTGGGDGDVDPPPTSPPLLSLSHDRPRNVPLSPHSPFLRRLGVTNADGKPAAGMSSKLRQCQKFVEIAGNLVSDAMRMSASSSSSAQGESGGGGAIFGDTRRGHGMRAGVFDFQPPLLPLR
jgi:hypothetical protein